MLEQTVAPILLVLERHPSSISARAVANEMRLPVARINTRLSKLALYGVIDRVKVKSRSQFRRHRCFAYRIKESAHA